eukprot:TRINITY_DN5990_c0_g1_i2.p4 TRINITY_DN5990_c0_g1~~TRINITY_DN5990_c0_g1_i2.p4  ORF type:complete len:131 (+),score=5.31 TRINITY_DN5990_c0_g1_i2:396-788(+)
MERGGALAGADLEALVVFKVSGRYQVVRDDVLEAVQAHPDHDVWYRAFGSWTHGPTRTTPGDSVAMTFFFAMRWRYFRDFYMEVWVPNLGGQGIEEQLPIYCKYKRLRIYHLPYLHVVANINSLGVLEYY